jgi:very-short-patch-repair endonuclease
MRVVEVMQRSGGVADARTLRHFASRRKIRTALLRGDIVRDGPGRYALPVADDALRAANRLSGVVSHDSAAAYYGWEMKHPPSEPSITVPRNRKLSPERRKGVAVTWARLNPGEIAHGMVTSPGRTVIDCAKTKPFDEALAIADSALRHGNLTKQYLLQLAEQVKGKGRSKCLRVAREASGKPANPFESVLRAISFDIPGLNLKPQLVIDEDGLAPRPDLVDEELRVVVEAESFEWHGRRKALKRDCERYNALALRGWLVIRFSWEHVMFEPEYVTACLRAIVAAKRPRRRANTGVPGQIPA